MAPVRPLHAEGAVEVTSLYLDLLGIEPPEDRPHVALNMVVSADGRATLRGTADIGSRTDRALLKHLRTLVDAVIVGAGTLRANDFTPRVTGRESLGRRELAGKREQPLAVVVSKAGVLPAERKFFSLPQERVVAVSRAATEATRAALRASGAAVVSFGEAEVDLAALLRWLRTEREVRVLLCEGGPHLAARLFGAGVLDEAFLTQSWRITGERGALALVESDAPLNGVRLEPVETYEGEGERYGRFRVTYAGV